MTYAFHYPIQSLVRFVPLLSPSFVDGLPFFLGSDVLPERELRCSCVRYHAIGTFIFPPLCFLPA